MLQRLRPLACPTKSRGAMQCTASGTRAPSPTDSDPSSDPSSAPSSSDSQDSSFVRRHTESTDPELERLLFAMNAAVLDAQ